MADGSQPNGFTPAIPTRRTKPAGLIEFLWIAWRDPLGMFGERHFDDLIIFGSSALGAAMTVSDPAGVRHVLLDNARNYDKGRLQRAVLGPMLAEGLLMVEGDDWKRARKLLAPLFTPSRLTHTAAQMAQVCQRRVDAWLLPGGSRVLDMDQEMTGLTFDIISATLFSDRLGGEARQFEAALNSFLDVTARVDPLDVLNAPAWMPRVGRLVGGGPGAFFERRVAELVAERRAEIEAGATPPDDLMTALLGAADETGGLSESEVAANILTFILAGHETTARALGWCLHLVSHAPEVMAKLQAEADGFNIADPDWQSKLPWTRAVIDETMRLFPPAPTMTRRAKADDVICGQPIKAGTTIILSPWVIQRHRKLWDDPDAFKPERFLPGAREKIDRYAYIPFSQGPRICIGASFAIQEAVIALASIMKAVSVESLTPREPMPTHRITLRAKGGIRLRIRPRV
jgi:cytochrome P450